MSPYFNKYFNSESSIKEKDKRAFHWQIDTLQFAKENSISVVTLGKNMDIITNILLNQQSKSTEVIINKFSEKKIISLVIVYDNLDAIEHIKIFLNYALDIAKQGVLLNKEDIIEKWDSINFHQSLNIKLENNKTVIKKKKL